MNSILLGADPEVFLKDKDKFIAACGKIGGTKDKPRKVGRGFNVHEDNVAVEYNIPPATEPHEWVSHHQYALDQVKLIADVNGCQVAIEADAYFDDRELKHPRAREFGCNPDYNAWTLEVNPSPNATQTNLRTAGGHIHIGMPGLDIRQKFQLVRVLDIFLGIPLAMLNPTSRRTELYGNLGACRPKKYGVEYRVPSNIWLRDVQFQYDVFESVIGICKHADEYSAIAESLRAQIEAIPPGALGRFDNEDVFKLIKMNMPVHSEAVYQGILEKV